LFFIADSAFPDNQKPPSLVRKSLLLPLVSFPVSLQFWQPKIQAGFRQAGESAVWVRMPVPKTPMDKYHLFPTWKY
jgi:hypothetical protein